MPWAAKKHGQQSKRKEDRPPPSARGYDWAWQKIRRAHLAVHPLCEDCKAAGRVTPATEVDHADGNVKNNEPGNHRSLCKSHHSRKTVRENGGLAR